VESYFYSSRQVQGVFLSVPLLSLRPDTTGRLVSLSRALHARERTSERASEPEETGSRDNRCISIFKSVERSKNTARFLHERYRVVIFLSLSYRVEERESLENRIVPRTTRVGKILLFFFFFLDKSMLVIKSVFSGKTDKN